VRLPWLPHDEAPGPYITIPQYWFNKTKQHTHHLYQYEIPTEIPLKMKLFDRNQQPLKSVAHLARVNASQSGKHTNASIHACLSGVHARWNMRGSMHVSIACMLAPYNMHSDLV